MIIGKKLTMSGIKLSRIYFKKTIAVCKNRTLKNKTVFFVCPHLLRRRVRVFYLQYVVYAYGCGWEWVHFLLSACPRSCASEMNYHADRWQQRTRAQSVQPANHTLNRGDRATQIGIGQPRCQDFFKKIPFLVRKFCTFAPYCRLIGRAIW